MTRPSHRGQTSPSLKVSHSKARRKRSFLRSVLCGRLVLRQAEIGYGRNAAASGQDFHGEDTCEEPSICCLVAACLRRSSRSSRASLLRARQQASALQIKTKTLTCRRITRLVLMRRKRSLNTKPMKKAKVSATSDCSLEPCCYRLRSSERSGSAHSKAYMSAAEMRALSRQVGLP